MKTEPVNQITKKSFHSLIELLKAYDVTINNVDVNNNRITYYVRVNMKDSLITLDAVLDNVYKILQMFTYPENSKHRIDLKYEVIK